LGEVRKKGLDEKVKPNFRTAAFALGVSVTADILDYVAAPIFSMPIIGDVFDVIVTGLLYYLTKSKVSVIINLAEFIPFGDFLPVYTVSTLIWILREYGFDTLIDKLLRLISYKR